VTALERQTLHLTLQTLEVRAARSDPVTLSPQFTRVVIKFLRRLVED
jgi:hypothetical protein